MANYINKYSNQSAYDADTTKQYPNTSLVGTEIVFAMEDTFDGIIATFNVTSTSEATKLLNDTGNVSKVWIDGVEQTEVIGSYQFLTTGEHEVKYALIDPTTTGNNAFRNCTGLTDITIPDTVINIGSRAFNGCESLESVTIGSGVTSIGYRAFYQCSGLTSITIPNTVTSIDSSAFEYCSGLTSITIGSGLTSIGGQAFRNCTSLTNIVVDSANTVYDSRNNCNAIINTSTNQLILGCKDTVIPNTVTSIGDFAFYGCRGLTSVTIPDSVTSIGNSAFYQCTSLTSVTIGSGVTTIDSNAFSGCSSLTSVTIPSSVTSIGYSAFNSCYGLTSISIPDSVTSIGNGAFFACTSLTSVNIGNGVTIIDMQTFCDCTGLESVTINATTPPTLGINAFANTNDCQIYVPAESVETYKTATNWSSYADRIVEIPSE